jgi:uncharacterized protein (TIGR03435 family)
MRPLLLLAIASATLAQSAFDVASVKEVLDFVPGTLSEKIIANPGTLTMRNVRLRACLKWAYDVNDYQIAAPSWMGAPGWGGREVARYDILAKALPDTPIAQMKLMLQGVLAERFKMTAHRETKEMSAYLLTLAKPAAALQHSSDQNAEASSVPGPEGLRFLAYPIADFADFLAAVLHSPVLIGPGLAGRYDITFKNLPGANAEEQLLNLTYAVRQQLGLALEKQKAPIKMLIVDSAEKHPTAN